MPKAKTANPRIPAPVIIGFADLNDQAADVLEQLNRLDLELADRLRATVDVLAAGSDADGSFDWRWKSGLHDFLNLMAAIRKVAGYPLRSGEERTDGLSVGAATDEQVAELVSMVRVNTAKRRAKFIAHREVSAVVGR